jgi:CheY-like chemotaxis protein
MKHYTSYHPGDPPVSILFLDDSQDRHTSFKEMMDELGAYDQLYAVEHVYSAHDAIELLDTHEVFDEVWLDHDLGTPETGQTVAVHIANMPEEKRPEYVVVHSANPVGADNMVKTLLGKIKGGVQRKLVSG